MKTTKFFAFSLLMLFALFNTSCKKDIEKPTPQNVEESAVVKSVVTLFRSGSTQNPRTPSATQTQNAISTYFCFQFNYPISLMYNDGSTRSLASDAEFTQAIVGQTNALYIINFVYPFDITLNGNVQNINSDADFETALNACPALNTVVPPTQNYCFDINYPVTLVYNDGRSIVVNNNLEFDKAILNGNTNLFVVNISYPFDVTINGQVQTINNSVEFQALVDGCFGTGVIVSNLPLSVFFFGMNIQFPITLVYNDGTTVVENNFQEYDNAVMSGSYIHYVDDFQYNITITQNGNTLVIHNITEFYDAVVISYNHRFNWNTHNLCFTFVYPLTVVLDNGQTLVVNNDNELNDAIAPPGPPSPHVTDFIYPFDVIKDGNTLTIHNRTEFNTLMNSCP